MSRSFGGRGGRVKPSSSPPERGDRAPAVGGNGQQGVAASSSASRGGTRGSQIEERIASRGRGASWGAMQRKEISRTWTNDPEPSVTNKEASCSDAVTLHTASTTTAHQQENKSVGSSSSKPGNRAGTATPGNRTSIDHLDAHFLHDHGYLVLPSFFSTSQIAHARNVMAEGLARAGGPPVSREGAHAWVKEKSSLQSHPSLLQLVHEAPLSKLLHNLFPQGIQQLMSCQIAFRFPGERVNEDIADKKSPQAGEVRETWYSDWHIDNFVQDYSYQPSEFSFLLGIYFSSNESDDAGNFTVFPGAHHRVEQFSRRKGGRAFFLQNKLKDLRTELTLNKPWQVQAAEGSVIIAHRMLPHTIAPNCTNTTREVVWYRVKLRDMQPDYDMISMWRGWGKLQQMLSLKFHLPESDTSSSSSFSSASSSSASTTTTLSSSSSFISVSSILAGWQQQLSQISSLGWGQLVTYDDDQIHFRCRPSRGDPGRFASMVSVYLSRTPPFKFTMHTNGFIARDMHSAMVHSFLQDTGGQSAVLDLFAIAHWISQCDFLLLIERWHPIPTSLSTAASSASAGAQASRRWDLHHLHSRSKSSFMRRWAEQLGLQANVQRGEPGCVEVSGERKAVEVFAARFSCFHWRHCDLTVCT